MTSASPDLTPHPVSEPDQFDFERGEFFLIDKPLGWTSFDVVAKIRIGVRKLTGRKLKVGHAGTLDPLATGLLLICCGKYTKRIQELTGMDKTYEGSMRLGQTTPSYDGETEPTAAVPTEHLSLEQLQTTTVGFLGKGEQLPPIFSAVKVDGKRLYKSARAGKNVERKARPMRVEQYNITAFQNPEAEFTISCSKGTYVRTLVHDLGQLVGVGAWMTSLRRTSIGPYRLEDAWELANLVERLRIAAEQSSSDPTSS